MGQFLTLVDTRRGSESSHRERMSFLRDREIYQSDEFGLRGRNRYPSLPLRVPTGDLEYDLVATMGCGDECPFVRAKHHENWVFQTQKVCRRTSFERFGI